MVPISLTSTFIFWDENGVKFILPFSATCDNCLLSVYSYLELNEGEYSINFDDKDYPQLTECDNAMQSESETLRSRRRLGTGMTFKKGPNGGGIANSSGGGAQLGGIKVQSNNMLKRSNN